MPTSFFSVQRSHRGAMRSLLAVGVCGLALAACAAQPGVQSTARPVMSEDEATTHAVDILRGTEYGDTYPGLVGRIKDRQLLTTGSNDCGPITTPVWAFRFQSPHEGWLYVDAKTGAKACSSLPFIR